MSRGNFLAAQRRPRLESLSIPCLRPFGPMHEPTPRRKSLVNISKKREIPFFNYPALFAQWEEEYMAIIRDVLRRGAYIMQRDLEEFETELARYLGVRHAIGVADGTNALLVSVLAAGIGP